MIKENTRRPATGSILIAVILAVTLAGLLGAGVAVLTSTSTLNELKADYLHRAYFLAESGLRYAYAEHNAGRDPSGDYSLEGGSGKFVVLVASPQTGSGTIYSSTGIVAAGTPFEARKTITFEDVARLPENVPLVSDDFTTLNRWQYNPGKVANIEALSDWGVRSSLAAFQNMNQASDNRTDAASLSAGCVNYGSGLPNIFDHWTSTWFPNPPVNPWVLDALTYPDRPGAIRADSPPTGLGHFTRMTSDSYTTEAGRISFDRFISTTSTSRILRFRIWTKKSTGEWVIGEWLINQGGGDQLSWVAESFPIAEGEHKFEWEYVLLDNASTGTGSNPVVLNKIWIDNVRIPSNPKPRAYRYEDMRLKSPDPAAAVDWAGYWAAGGFRLSYDVQVKQSWGDMLWYGGGGVNFRWHAHPDFVDRYQGFGVSLLWHKGRCEADFLPDGIKPRDASAGQVNGETAESPLLVLWEQRIDSATGQARQEWLACLDLSRAFPDRSSPEDTWVLDPRWKTGGVHFTDLISLWVRLEEKMDLRGRKFQEIKIFYGDAAHPSVHPLRNAPPFAAGDAIADNLIRRVYPPSSAVSPVPWPGVKWPPNDIGNWGPGCDYMTLVKWTKVNPAPQSASFALKADGATIRTTDFLSPNLGETFPLPTGSQTGGDEIGLHAMGKIEFNNGAGIFDVIAFDDFAVQVLGRQGAVCLP